MQVYLSTVVISKPDDVIVFEGRSTTFTCVLDGSITSDDVQWYRLIKDTNTTEIVHQQDSSIDSSSSTINNALTTTLTITNATKSHTGYYWVELPSLNVCNVTLTVLTSMCIHVQFIV